MKDNELIHCIENIAVSWVNPFVDGIITAKEDARVQEQLDFIQEVLVMSVTCPLPSPCHLLPSPCHLISKVIKRKQGVREYLILMSVTCPLPCPLPSTLPSTVKIDSLRKN